MFKNHTNNEQTTPKSRFLLHAGVLVLMLILGFGSVQAGSVFSVQSGDWNDPAVWNENRVPNLTQDDVILNHTLSYTGDIEIGGTHRLHINRGAKLQQQGNLQNNGIFNLQGSYSCSGTVRNRPNGTFFLSGELNGCGEFYNDCFGLVYHQGYMSVGKYYNNSGTVYMTGTADITGRFVNKGMQMGLGYTKSETTAGRYNVCGDAYHMDTITAEVKGLIYLCMECGGQYYDLGKGTFDLNCSVFPIEIKSFYGTESKGEINLHWETYKEENLSSYLVERATNIETEVCSLGVCAESPWVEIGMVAAQGNTETGHKYDFTDRAPQRGVNFYRLKILDRNGSISYSSTIEVFNTDDGTKWVVYPNPNNSVLKVRLMGTQGTETQLYLFDIQGKKVWEKKVTLTESEQTFEINSSKYAAGTYILKATTDGKDLTRKVVFYK